MVICERAGRPGDPHTATQRSSSVVRTDEKQGDVVIAGRGLFGVAEEDIGEGVEVLGFHCCQVASERVGGVVDVGAGGFDESVGVQG